MKYRSVLLLGAPGSGKGTQGKILGAIPGFVHYACGDVFRSLDLTSELGRAFHSYSSRGELVPDSFTIQLWHQAVDRLSNSGGYNPKRDMLVLDGIPRNVEQARLMDEFLDVAAVIHLRCDDQSLLRERMRIRALKSNRLDDADDAVITRRLALYEVQTSRLMNHYPWSLVHEVDAGQSQIEVLMDILEKLHPISGAANVTPAAVWREMQMV